MEGAGKNTKKKEKVREEGVVLPPRDSPPPPDPLPGAPRRGGRTPPKN